MMFFFAFENTQFQTVNTLVKQFQHCSLGIRMEDNSLGSLPYS